VYVVRTSLPIMGQYVPRGELSRLAFLVTSNVKKLAPFHPRDAIVSDLNTLAGGAVLQLLALTPVLIKSFDFSYDFNAVVGT
jgi:hypothetical protein